jgi:predicted component of type VI protein secretion system
VNGAPRDVLERVIRQLLQTYGPAIYVVLTSPTAASGDVKALFVALASIAVGTGLKNLARLKAAPDAPLGVVLLDRAGSAFAATLLGLGVSDLTGLLSVDWGSKGILAAIASALLGLLTFYGMPPANEPSSSPTAVPPNDGPGDDGALPQRPTGAGPFPTR